MLNKFTDKLAQLKRQSEERVAQSKAFKLGKPYLDLSKRAINVEPLSLIDEETAKSARIVPIERKANNVIVAVFDTQDPKTISVIAGLETHGYKVNVYIVSLSTLNYVLDFYKFADKIDGSITGKVAIEEKIAHIAEKANTIEGLKEYFSKQNFSPSKAGEILEIILHGAMANRASDIHLEAQERNGLLRLRIDGNLHNIFEFPKEFYPYVVTRIKLLSNLKLNVTKEAQDGRFTIGFSTKNVEVRVAVAPAQFGEVVVMRLLDPDSINIKLEGLGLRGDDLKIVEEELNRPNGMILNTGPTGSGKTTTLYAFLQHQKSPEIKIITIEDPVEYHLDGIEQTQVSNETGYTFANGLRSLMRQDPDVILVGEIRDQETAEIAIQAALTGHLVFSTIHANSAAGAVPRLLDLRVNPISISPALALVIAQRLVRRLCPECKTPTEPTEEQKIKLQKFLESLPERVDKEKYKNISLFQPKGCLACNNIGYKGRIAVYELLRKTTEMEPLIASGSGESTIFEYAKKQGMTSMQEDGILKVIQGITTFEEVEEATGKITW